MRDFALSIVISLLYKYPYIQTIIMLIFNGVMLSYLLILRPLIDFLDSLHQLICEFIVFGVNIGVLLLASFDENGVEEKQNRKEIGSFLIIANLVFNFLGLLVMLTKLGIFIFRNGKRLFAKTKKKKNSTRRNWSKVVFRRRFDEK